jgi:acetyl-CoA carboxylase carboxyltransferase component
MGGMFQSNDLRLAWPSIEGGGGLSDEGAATLALRKEWEATNADAGTRRRMRDELAGRMRERSSFLEPGRKYRVDDVIDPAETRQRMIAMLDFFGESPKPDTKKHFIDAG